MTMITACWGLDKYSKPCSELDRLNLVAAAWCWWLETPICPSWWPAKTTKTSKWSVPLTYRSLWDKKSDLGSGECCTH